jgi:hypothetical protein
MQSTPINRSSRRKMAICAVVVLALGQSAGSAQEAGVQSAVMNRLDSLERVIRLSDSALQQRAAIRELASYGDWRLLAQAKSPAPAGQVRYPGIVARLVRVYPHIKSTWVREEVIEVMPLQAEELPAATFLEQVATDTTHRRSNVGHNLTLPAFAVMMLTYMPEGRESLRRLHATRAVKEPKARSVLDSLARRSFQPPR